MTSDEGKPGEQHVAFGPALSGWNSALGLSFVSATDSEVIADMQVSEKHFQPMGIVHGGVYCAMVETVCSVGAYLSASKHGLLVVGVDNHTSFLRATRRGTLRTTGKPLVRGRRTQLWEARIDNEQGELVATGRVRILCIEPGSNLGGEVAGARGRD